MSEVDYSKFNSSAQGFSAARKNVKSGNSGGLIDLNKLASISLTDKADQIYANHRAQTAKVGIQAKEEFAFFRHRNHIELVHCLSESYVACNLPERVHEVQLKEIGDQMKDELIRLMEKAK